MLDSRNRNALWVNSRGVVVGSIGPLRAPTDIAVDSFGTVYVADQSEGGIQVYETDGGFRLRLGMVGREGDTFEGLDQLAVDAKDNLYALDSRRRTIQRFDRFHRRLKTWSIPGDQKIAPVDIAAHQGGLLVLMANGEVRKYDDSGAVAATYGSAATMQLGVRLIWQPR